MAVARSNCLRTFRGGRYLRRPTVQLNRYTEQHLLLRSRCACVISSCGLICNRWSALLVVFHPRRQTELRIHRLLPDRIAGRRKDRGVKRTHSYSADGRVAISFPMERGAAIRAEMKSNAIAARGGYGNDTEIACPAAAVTWLNRCFGMSSRAKRRPLSGLVSKPASMTSLTKNDECCIFTARWWTLIRQTGKGAGETA
jgi:hypothetical protein